VYNLQIAWQKVVILTSANSSAPSLRLSSLWLSTISMMSASLIADGIPHSGTFFCISSTSQWYHLQYYDCNMKLRQHLCSPPIRYPIAHCTPSLCPLVCLSCAVPNSTTEAVKGPNFVTMFPMSRVISYKILKAKDQMSLSPHPTNKVQTYRPNAALIYRLRLYDMPSMLQRDRNYLTMHHTGCVVVHR